MGRQTAFLIAVAWAALLAGCGRPPESSQAQIGEDQPPASSTSPEQTTVVRVSTAKQLVEAIGSDRTLELAAGDYILSDVPDRHMDFVRWDPEFDGKTITIRNVRHLVIRGAKKGPTRLLVRPSYAYVLNFEDCESISLENLTLGHAPEKGHCTSGVVGATDCEKLTVRSCDLFGCGTEGLTLERVRSLRFEDSIIRDCSYGILTAKSCADLRFTRSQFNRNSEFWGVRMHDSKGILFDTCSFESNKIEEELFRAVSCSGISVKGGRAVGNICAAISNNPSCIVIEGMHVSEP